MAHILLMVVIMHYIFLISFDTTKIFKFQSYYSNSHSLKEIIMISKIYHMITIDITQTINSILNTKLSLPILKYPKLDQSESNRSFPFLSTPNGPKWTKLDLIDRMD